MPKRGDTARESVKNTIINAFAATGDYVTTQDKKIYVQARDGSNGEIIQFAITMTMPKTPVSAAPAGTWAPGGSLDSETVGLVSATPTPAPIEMSPADKAAVDRLKQILGVV